MTFQMLNIFPNVAAFHAIYVHVNLNDQTDNSIAFRCRPIVHLEFSLATFPDRFAYLAVCFGVFSRLFQTQNYSFIQLLLKYGVQYCAFSMLSFLCV